MTELKKGLPAHEYHALPRLSSSILRRANSRALYRHALDNPPRTSPEMELGTAIHARLLNTWAEEVAEMPEDAVDASSLSALKAYAESIGAKRRRSLAEQKTEIRAHEPDAVFSDEVDAGDGRIIVTPELVERVDRICDAVRRNPYAAGMLVGAEPEVSALWNEEHDGVSLPSKARADLLHADALIDVKTTSKRDIVADPAAFTKHVFNYGWHRQLDWYERGFGRRESVFVIAIYVGDPALCEVYQIDRDFLDIGREANDLALDRIVSWQRHPDGWGGPSADANGRPTIAEIAPLPWMFR